MYQNKVNLIGFLGSDAEVRTANNRSFTTLSLATKSSYKDKSGQYVSHTEWHRCVVFGKLSEFAGTLTKGAHVQVEGELRSRRVRQQEDRREAAHLGDPRGFDPQAGPGREGLPGRAGKRQRFERGAGRIGRSSSPSEARLRAGLPRAVGFRYEF